MVWPGGEAPPPGSEFGEIPRHPMRPGMRPGFFPYPRRGAHMRGPPPFFPPRLFMPGQGYMHQRKGRPPWGPRPRGPPPPPPPHFVPPPPDSFMPYPPPAPWPQPLPPPPPSDSQADPDTTSDMANRKKKKRVTNGTLRPWDKEAAEKAHALELECQRNANAKSIVIRFPDPELSKEIVQAFHTSIDNVHFQGPCGGRYCFVTLKDEANVDQVMEEINTIKFGVGCLNAERKVQKPEENACYENIDPFTLYVGNLALNITVSEVKEKFPSASRIDVGHAKKMKNTRYAFVKFSTAEAALEAYRVSVNTIMASRSIIVRFRRHKAPVGPPGEKPASGSETPKPTSEKLTVGAKLKAKKEKAAREAAEAESRAGTRKINDDGESEDEIEMENDEDSLSDYDMDEFDVDDDDDDDEMENINQDSESEYEMSGEEYKDASDDDDQFVTPTTKDEDDEYYDDDDDCKDVFSLTFDKSFNR